MLLIFWFLKQYLNAVEGVHNAVLHDTGERARGHVHADGGRRQALIIVDVHAHRARFTCGDAAAIILFFIFFVGFEFSPCVGLSVPH